MSFRPWVFAAIGLFLAGLAMGGLASGVFAQYLAGNLAGLRDLASMLGPYKIATAAFIFIKNASTLLLSFALSPLLLLFPIMVLVLNGALITFVAVIVAQQYSLSPWLIAAALLPHGIVELTAIMIGEAAALRFGVRAMRALVLENRRPGFVVEMKQDLKYLVIACMLLVPAALVETYITPLLVGK